MVQAEGPRRQARTFAPVFGVRRLDAAFRSADQLPSRNDSQLAPPTFRLATLGPRLVSLEAPGPRQHRPHCQPPPNSP